MKKTDVPSSTKLVSKGNKRRRPEIVAVTKDHEIRGNNKQTTASNEETFDDMIDDDGSGDDDDEDDDDDDDDENNDGNGNNNNNDDVDSVLDDSENDNAPEKPAAKKPRVAAKSSDSRYKLPTTEEIHALKETTDLFQSNLFKLQIDELLREATPDYTKSGPLDKTLHAIKNVLDSCESTPSLNLTDAIKTLRKHGVEIPFSRVDGPSPETTKYTFSFVKPSKVFIAGSYLVKTITKSRHGFNVDVAVHMPDDGFTEKDHLNNRYFHKRAYYLAVIAAALKESPAFNDTEISFQLLNKDPRRPVIAISLPTTALAAGFAGPGTAITIRVIPVVSPDLFSVHKLAPGRNNNRPSTDLKNNGSGSSIENFPPTPRYNSAILMDTGLIAHLNAMHSRAAACAAFRDAVVLGKVWLNQRIDGGAAAAQFGGFLWGVVLLYLFGDGNKAIVQQAGGNGIILRDSFSSYQIVKLAIEFLAIHNFAESPIFLTPDGSAIDDPDFSAEAFKSQFDCAIVDSTGRYNLAAFVNASTLNHLQFEARASINLFKDLGSDRFDALFLKNLTDPAGYFDLIVRINKIPESFAGYKPSIQIDWPSKRQFFTHFVSRLLRLGIKVRTRLIKVSDAIVQPTITWDLNKPTPEDDKDSAILIGLILNYDTAIEPVEYGPQSGEDTKAIESFRRLWGTKSSLRRFTDGSLTESVVWETDNNVEDRILITGRMAAYLVSRHVSVSEENLTFWGNQFGNVLKEFGGNKKSSEIEHRVNTFLNATEAFNEFSKSVKSLEDIPLEITSIVACDSALRNSSTFVPQPSLAGDNFGRLNPIQRDKINVLIDFEDSYKWPSDTIPALQYMKLAFGIKIAEQITRQFPGTRATVTKPDLKDLTTGTISVRMKNGYEFCARIRTGRETKLAAAAVKAAEQSGDGAIKAAAQTRFDATDRVYRAHGVHTLAYQNAHFKYAQMSATARLVKRWLAAHWVMPHFTEEAVELIVVRVFSEHAAGAGATTAYPSAPASVFAGVLRVLEVFWKWEWEKEAMVVEFEKGEFPTNKKSEVLEKFGDGRNKKSGVMCLPTVFDESGFYWTKDGPSLIVLKRVKQLAKAAYKLLKDAIVNGDESEIAKIFVTPTDGYDYIIQLDVSKLPTYHQNIAYNAAKLPQPKSAFKNLVALEKRPLQRFLEEFNPVVNYVKDLENAFADTATFFFDINGGDRIGVLLNKKLVVAEQPWKVNIPFSVMPQLVLEDKKDDQDEPDTPQQKQHQTFK